MSRKSPGKSKRNAKAAKAANASGSAKGASEVASEATVERAPSKGASAGKGKAAAPEKSGAGAKKAQAEPAKADKADKPNKADKPDKADKPAKAGKGHGADSSRPPAKGDGKAEAKAEHKVDSKAEAKSAKDPKASRAAATKAKALKGRGKVAEPVHEPADAPAESAPDAPAGKPQRKGKRGGKAAAGAQAAEAAADPGGDSIGGSVDASPAELETTHQPADGAAAPVGEPAPEPSVDAQPDKAGKAGKGKRRKAAAPLAYEDIEALAEAYAEAGTAPGPEDGSSADAIAAVSSEAAEPEVALPDEPGDPDELDDDGSFPSAAARAAQEAEAPALDGDASAAAGEAGLDGEASLGEAAPDGDVAEEDEDGGLAATLPTSANQLSDPQLAGLLEALIFASDKPLTLQRLRQLTRVSDSARLARVLEQLTVQYQGRGIALSAISGGYQFRTESAYSGWVQQLIAGRPVRLSRAQLETLAIIAYRQPITRPEIDEIRGVDSTGTLKMLMDRNLVRILGKREEVGRPMLYGTTKEFLDFFSLGDLRELPTLREYSELSPESRAVVSKMGFDAPGGGGDGQEAADGAPHASPEGVEGVPQDAGEPWPQGEPEEPLEGDGPGVDTARMPTFPEDDSDYVSTRWSEHDGEESSEAGPAGEQPDSDDPDDPDQQDDEDFGLGNLELADDLLASGAAHAAAGDPDEDLDEALAEALDHELDEELDEAAADELAEDRAAPRVDDPAEVISDERSAGETADLAVAPPADGDEADEASSTEPNAEPGDDEVEDTARHLAAPAPEALDELDELGGEPAHLDELAELPSEQGDLAPDAPGNAPSQGEGSDEPEDAAVVGDGDDDDDRVPTTPLPPVDDRQAAWQEDDAAPIYDELAGELPEQVASTEVPDHEHGWRSEDEPAGEPDPESSYGADLAGDSSDSSGASDGSASEDEPADTAEPSDVGGQDDGGQDDGGQDDGFGHVLDDGFGQGDDQVADQLADEGIDGAGDDVVAAADPDEVTAPLPDLGEDLPDDARDERADDE